MPFTQNSLHRLKNGGRDITVRTHELPGHESELYIFQCKFLNKGNSLTAKKIVGAAETIMQFNAKGYGVFTSGIIDATLYDFLDGISRSYNISTKENWSIFELERYLSQNINIYNKYFS